MLESMIRRGMISLEELLDRHADTVAEPLSVPRSAAEPPPSVTGTNVTASPTADTLQTTAEVAAEVQQSVEAAVQTANAGKTVKPSADKSVEIATQIASILVLTQGLLNSDLEAAGSRPFDLPKVAAADLDRLVASRRLVERLAVSGGDKDACAVAAARIDASIERLEILVGIIGSKVSEVRQMIAEVGMESDIDEFEASINALLERIGTVRDTSKTISASPLDKAAGAMIQAADAVTDAFQKSIEAVVDAIDGAALAGALGGGEMAESPVAAATPIATDDSLEVTPEAPPLAAPPPAAAPSGASASAQRWLDRMKRDHGTLEAAAAHYDLDSATQLSEMIEDVAARSYDPLQAEDRTFGGNINYLFGEESRVWNTSTRSVLQHAGNLQFEQKTLRLLAALQKPDRPDRDEESKREERLKAERRRAPLGEVVILPGLHSTPEGRPSVRPLSTPPPRIGVPPGSTS